ncbi:hypothetical protein BV902_12505 [Sphingobacterium sp. B29]|uniref:hypothetical protein n=1 Tax=Sphingobacterium sp. B29 TaxID=1933220 RepID=UPI000958B1CC|nr:hypothetical protein [Sphingobacterium sp. B29]APU97066.1 hypothetical protein BV902_12505 [Sphingobacterium sp. B29]
MGFRLGAKEGRALQLPQDADKIESLLETGSGYRIFLNLIKEENWDKRMLKLYVKNIVNYLRTKTKFQRKNPIDILFSLEYGWVVATITDGQTKKSICYRDPWECNTNCVIGLKLKNLFRV